MFFIIKYCKHISWIFISILFLHNLQSQNSAAFCYYSQREFDSDTCCWRQLLKQDSFIQAANLILAFKACHKPKENIHSLNWHAGQMFAYEGMNHEAKHYFKKTFNIFTKWFGGKEGLEWYLYAKGTVAFLDRRKATLDKIINRWDKKLSKNLNYNVLFILNSNFDSSYRSLFKE